ncbi:MAG TPA: pilus assembly protein N-terminal domain-containing protein [Verrucomicrobiae bacterium]|nr:pilus assembly protein N-terminal domain-containing protein [Verrucomicrobiae bacterium]
MKKMQWRGVGIIAVLLAGLLVISDVRAEQQTVQVSVGESVVVPSENVSKIALADPSIADVVNLSDKELSIIGKKAGVTTLTIVKNDNSATLMYRIEVGNDAAAVTIRQMIGNNNINVHAIGDALVLDGKVNDEIEAQRAALIAGAYKAQVVNLLEVTKPRQIKVRIRIAEVNTEAIKNIGFQWFGPQGQVQYAMQYIGGGSIVNGFIPTASEFGSAGSSITPTTVTLTMLLDMLITKSYGRLLSEPTLVTFSGKEASFLVGEEIPIIQQLPQSFTVEFKEVGVRMKIKPTADSENRINTTIHAEVSQVIGTGANSIPIIGAKTADTTLQVNDGQTIVIGGLLENNVNRDVLRKLPWLAEIPVIGALFRDKQFDQSKREVLFFMTPEVIKDIDVDMASAPKTPGLQHWVTTWNKGKMIEPPDKKDDWGLHNPQHMGFPVNDEDSVKPAKKAAKPAASAAPATKPASTAKPATAQPAATAPTVATPPVAAQPATGTPAQEPSTNYSPSRPAE